MVEPGPSADDRPLRGARVLITRPWEDGADLAAAVEGLGGEAYSVPLLRIEGPEDPGPLEEARRNLGSFDWVALTSRHAARALLEGIPEEGSLPKIAVVGVSTERCVRDLGRRADLVSGGKGAAALAAAMIGAGAAGTKILHPRSNLASDDLRRLLEEAGCVVLSFEAYRTLPPGGPERAALQGRLREGNAAVFASPSAVAYFAGIARGEKSALFDDWIAVGIGPTTGAALREAGFTRIAEADRPDDSGLLEALTEAWRTRARSKRNEP
ncbi:MAG: uroporphyrinogen-III synthase [Candidatus Eisenbacteria bacterium]